MNIDFEYPAMSKLPSTGITKFEIKDNRLNGFEGGNCVLTVCLEGVKETGMSLVITEEKCDAI